MVHLRSSFDVQTIVFFQFTGPASEGRKLYVSTALGNDSWSCDQSKPCQTIGRAAFLASNGDQINLDGTETDKHPYTCQSGTSEYPGIYINKSLSLIGHGSPMPQIRCSEGKSLTFSGSDTPMNVTLAGLLVTGNMIFQDSSVKIDGCKFEGQKQGLKLVISNEMVSRIQITNSTFSENRQCISVVVNGTRKTSLGNQVVFLLTEASFTGNDVSYEESCISFTKWSYTDQPLIFNITLENVTFSRNKFGASGVILFKMGDNVTQNINLKNVTFLDNSPPLGQDVVTGDGHSECVIQNGTVNLFLSACTFISQNSRSFSVVASHISLHIHNSNFSGHNVKGKGGVISLWGKDNCNVNVSGSSFVNTTAVQGGAMNIKCTNPHNVSFQDNFFLENKATNGRGGALHIYSQSWNSTEYSTDRATLGEISNHLPPISISRCNFNNTFSSSEGGAVAICMLQAYVQLSNSAFNNCTALEGGGVFIHTGFFSLLSVDNCNFTRCNTSGLSWGGSLVASYGTHMNITVHDSHFMSNYGGALNIYSSSIFGASWTKKSQVTIQHSLFLNNSGIYSDFDIGGVVSIAVWNHSLVIFKNVTMESNRVLRFTGTATIGMNSTLKIYQSKFLHNTVYNCGGAIKAINLNQVQVQDSVFDGNYAYSALEYVFESSAGGSLCILNTAFANKINIFNTSFLNCFSNSSGGALYVYMSHWGSLDLGVQRTRFINNLAFSESGGAISVVLNPDTQSDLGCRKEDEHHICTAERFPSWDYKSRMSFEDTTFESNAAVSGGAVHLTYGKAVFRNCSFIDNFAKAQGGHVYTLPGSSSLIILDSFFLQTVNERLSSHGISLYASTASFIHTESSGNLTVHNTTFDSRPYGISRPLIQVRNGRRLHIEENSNFSCPVGSKMAILNFQNQFVTSVINASCKFNLSTLEFTCSACPRNSYSLQRGQALGLQLVQGFQCLSCPFGANCSQNIVAKPNFWGFKDNKNPQALNFTLCPLGYCLPPYRRTNLSIYNGCQGNRSGELCGACEHAHTETLYSTDCRPSHKCNDYWFWPVALVYVSVLALVFAFQPPIVPWIGRQILWFKHHEPANPDNVFDKGYVKILFYFYQTSNLLFISTSARHVISKKFIEPLVGLFNFQQKLSSSGLICPFPGLTVVTKQLFSASHVFGTLLMIGVFYALYWRVQTLRGQEAPSVEPYVGGVLQTMLLGYTTLASVSFSLLRCVPIGSEQRLFFDGNIACFQWWQYVMIVFILTFVLPFVLVLLWGSLKLYNGMLSVGEFLVACCFSLPLLLYWAYNSLYRGARNPAIEDSPCSQLPKNSVERVLYGCFKSPESGSRLPLCWESVMIGRRLILIVLRALISDPMPRLLVMILFCVFFLLHHALIQPFRDSIANTTETVSLTSVVILAVVNTFFASSVSLAVPLNDHFSSWYNACQVVEIIILCAVPALFGVVLVAAVLSQLCRLTVAICRIFYHMYCVCFNWCCGKIAEERRPVLTREK